MKLLIEVSQKKQLYLSEVDGLILALHGYSVESVCTFTLEEIQNIRDKYHGELFVKINKNFMNEEIDGLREVLLKLQDLSITGIFFYDLAVLELWRELSLSYDLVWNQTHMVNNYKTCNYYYSKGVKYALLGKEITLDEILEINDKSTISTMIEVVSRPSVAFSKRKLLTNYYHDMGKKAKQELVIREGVTGDDYHLFEDDNGTQFFLNTITNGTGIIKSLYDSGIPYIIMREFGLEDVFGELVRDTKKYLSDGCVDCYYVEKYKKLGDSTNFFFKKTIYRVKKNEKN